VESGPSDKPVEVKFGYVEELEQTKLIAFLSIASERDLTISIHADK
jgi:hypothetical protein